jgi:hypothetical protein
MNRFFCAAVAALTLRAMDPYGNGKLVLLEVTYARDYHTNSIYVVALIVGILGASHLPIENLEAYLSSGSLPSVGHIRRLLESRKYRLDEKRASKDMDEVSPDLGGGHGSSLGLDPLLTTYSCDHAFVMFSLGQRHHHFRLFSQLVDQDGRS